MKKIDLGFLILLSLISFQNFAGDSILTPSVELKDIDFSNVYIISDSLENYTEQTCKNYSGDPVCSSPVAKTSFTNIKLSYEATSLECRKCDCNVGAGTCSCSKCEVGL